MGLQRSGAEGDEGGPIPHSTPGLGEERPQPLLWGSKGAILLGQALPLEVEFGFPASLAA